jgi:hypothetical protein
VWEEKKGARGTGVGLAMVHISLVGSIGLERFLVCTREEEQAVISVKGCRHGMMIRLFGAHGATMISKNE